MLNTKANATPSIQSKDGLTLTFANENQFKHFEKLYLHFAYTPREECLEAELSLYRMALMAIIGESHEIDSTKDKMAGHAYTALTHGEILNDLYHMTDHDEEE